MQIEMPEFEEMPNGQIRIELDDASEAEIVGDVIGSETTKWDSHEPVGNEILFDFIQDEHRDELEQLIREVLLSTRIGTGITDFPDDP